MTQETDDLKANIERIKKAQSDADQIHMGKPGYNATINILTDLFGCVLIGLAIGIAAQTYLDTSVLLTASLTILGGVAGLWTVVRYGLAVEKREDQENEREKNDK